MNNSDKASDRDSEDDLFEQIEFQRVDSASDNSDNSKQDRRKRRDSDLSVKTVASRLSNYVTVVRGSVSEAARQNIPGYREASEQDYQCCD